MEYSQTGNYVALAGLIVTLLSHFGLNVAVGDITTVIGAIVVIVGLAKQYIAHKNLAIQAGVPLK